MAGNNTVLLTLIFYWHFGDQKSKTGLNELQSRCEQADPATDHLQLPLLLWSLPWPSSSSLKDLRLPLPTQISQNNLFIFKVHWLATLIASATWTPPCHVTVLIFQRVGRGGLFGGKGIILPTTINNHNMVTVQRDNMVPDVMMEEMVISMCEGRAEEQMS